MRGWWDGVLTASLAAGLTMACGCSGASAQDHTQEHARILPACGGDTIANAVVSRVIDGRTFVLNDGREVRLAAIEVPPLPLPQETDAAPGGAAARDALAALLGNGAVTLKQAEPQKTDRYGRLVAYAFAAAADGEHLVQADLLAAGQARVAAHVTSHACAMELLGREKTARRAKLGLWANSYYDMLNADNPTAVLAEQGHFALVEGNVLSVRESGATIYVNFGRRWTEDFTVTILKRNERNFAAAGFELKKLAGRHVRVRGWIEERGGPWIEATRPEQIELADRE
jgi:endonuclease YncB( thermonuclease family)